jgi:hypothetical protein
MNNYNVIDFSNVGNSVSKDSNSFKKIQRFSKITTNNLVRDSLNDSQVFSKINNLYNNPSPSNNNSYSYGTARQHNHTSLSSFLPSFTTLVDKKGLDKFCEYSLNKNKEQSYEKSLKKFFNQVSNTNLNFEKKNALNLTNVMNTQSFLNNLNLNKGYLDFFFFK